MAIAVYGATGRTGRLVLRELERRGLACVGAGRDRAALDALDGGAETRAGTLDDPASLDRVLDGCSVLVNCAGPQEALAEAAVRNGVHLVDGSGSQAFVRSLLDDFGPRAEARGVCVVPAMGFDYAVGDCLARLAAQGHEPLAELVVAYAIEGAGTAGDAVADGGGGEVVFTDGSFAEPPGGVRRISFTFPEPIGRQVMQRYGAGEAITVPRHTRTRSVVTLITAATWSPHPALVPAVPYLRPLAAAARRSPVASRALAIAGGMAQGRGGAPSGEEEAARAGASFTVAAVARGEDGTVGRAIAEGGDYDRLTAGVLAVGAARLAEGESVAAGGLSPAQAFDPAWLLDALAGHDLRWRRE
jgi:short subunit dehydrogenase-like uncharacterized protein